jgi:hypothetical protein
MPVLKIAGPSYSSIRLNRRVWLVAETHEPGLADDGYVHLYASDDAAQTFTDVFKRRYASFGSYARMLVQFTFPNNDILIRIEGYGTIVGRVVTSATG